ncbi:MAG: hypothetical protein AAF108_05300 [Planctomycetota bacterium]
MTAEPVVLLRKPEAQGITYGRARLLLGVSGVGAWVVLATGLLLAEAPPKILGWVGTELGVNVLVLLAALLGYVALHAGFDVIGGYVLPRRYGRSTQPFGSYAAGWIRGVGLHAGLMLAVALAMLLASRGPGVPGMVIVGVAVSLLLLKWRVPLARQVGSHGPAEPSDALDEDVRVVDGRDVGFTGGIDGVFRPAGHVVPSRWVEELSADELTLAIARRRRAVETGLWERGRWISLVFTWAGLGVAAGQVEGLAGTAGGVVQFSLVFTLWSFAGLLLLPTVTRRASHAVDASLVESGTDPEALRSLLSRLDAMQDGEPSRPGWIESIFHPIPNADSRVAGEGEGEREDQGQAGAARGRPRRRVSRLAGYDTARTAAFVSLSGLGLLGRAVHCNSGRPALWVFLPLD